MFFWLLYKLLHMDSWRHGVTWREITAWLRTLAWCDVRWSCITLTSLHTVMAEVTAVQNPPKTFTPRRPQRLTQAGQSVARSWLMILLNQWSEGGWTTCASLFFFFFASVVPACKLPFHSLRIWQWMKSWMSYEMPLEAYVCGGKSRKCRHLVHSSAFDGSRKIAAKVKLWLTVGKITDSIKKSVDVENSMISAGSCR